MCGRVYMAPANPELRELVREMNRSRLAERFRKDDQDLPFPEGEVFPSSVLPVLAVNRNGEQRVFPMKWGFTQPRGRLLINARVETAAEKPTFREAWQRHRCVIPASGYFEWEHDEKKKPGQKYALLPEAPGLIWLAGLYRMEEDLPAFVILTRPADSSLAWMHDRMPVMLAWEEAHGWIRPEADPAPLADRCIRTMAWEKAV